MIFLAGHGPRLRALRVLGNLSTSKAPNSEIYNRKKKKKKKKKSEDTSRCGKESFQAVFFFRAGIRPSLALPKRQAPSTKEGGELG